MKWTYAQHWRCVMIGTLRRPPRQRRTRWETLQDVRSLVGTTRAGLLLVSLAELAAMFGFPVPGVAPTLGLAVILAAALYGGALLWAARLEAQGVPLRPGVVVPGALVAAILPPRAGSPIGRAWLLAPRRGPHAAPGLAEWWEVQTPDGWRGTVAVDPPGPHAELNGKGVPHV